MRTLPLFASLLCTATLAGANELELLQSRVAEQERTIRQLEDENNRLQSLLGTAASTPAAKETSAAASAPTAHATVLKGDSLAKLAKRHGTTTDALIRVNKLKNPSLIRPGDKILLPAKASTPPSASPRPIGSTHMVKSGETFYSIALQHGLDTAALQAANPSIQATSLRPGQTLQLVSQRTETPRAEHKESNPPQPATPPPATYQLATAKPTAPAPLEDSSLTVANTPRCNSVYITEETNFGAFAAAHGTSTERLNALNGLHLNPSTVLAKGSELYVPAQP